MALGARLLPSVLARYHSACGWLTFRLGMRRRARHHYEQVVCLSAGRRSPVRFSAHLHLGHIAYGAGDYRAWRRELERALLLDPARFARRRRTPPGAGPRLAGTGLESSGAPEPRSPGTAGSRRWPGILGTGTGIGIFGREGNTGSAGSRPPSDTAPSTSASAPFYEGPPLDEEALDRASGSVTSSSKDEPSLGEAPGGERREAVRDDCGDEHERLRLRELGPIRRGEWARCDLDELARRLGS